MAIVTPDLGQSLHIPRERSTKEMLSVSSTAEGKRRVKINASSLMILQECYRKAQYKLLQKWEPDGESPATIFGSAIHRALELFYLIPPEVRYVPDLEELELLAASGNRPSSPDPLIQCVLGFLDRGQALAPLPDTDKRSLKNGVWLLWNYFKTFKDDPYVAYEDEDGPFVERTFTLTVYEDSEIIIDLFGTVDFVFRHTVTGDLLPGDHKTSSSLYFGESSYYDREKPNHQYTGYLLGLQKVFNLNVKDFMVSIFEVKARPKTPRGSGPSFPRQITSRSEDDFAELIETLTFYVRLYLDCLKMERWPMGSVDSCNKYGGCSYKQVCAAPHSLRENILQSKFVRGE